MFLHRGKPVNLERKTKKQQTIKPRRATKEQQLPLPLPRWIIESSLLLRFARLLHPTSPLPHPPSPLPLSPNPAMHVLGHSCQDMFQEVCAAPWPKNSYCFKLPPPLQKNNHLLSFYWDRVYQAVKMMRLQRNKSPKKAKKRRQENVLTQVVI